MPKKKRPVRQPRPPRESFRTIQLSAIVLAEPAAEIFFSQEQFAAMFKVTPQTLRDWVAKGMPRAGTKARPRYPSTAVRWATAYQIAVAVHERRGGDVSRSPFPNGLTLEEARDYVLAIDLDDPVNRGHFVVVPLDHDHPAREAQLIRAARGIAPPLSAEVVGCIGPVAKETPE